MPSCLLSTSQNIADYSADAEESPQEPFEIAAHRVESKQTQKAADYRQAV